MRVFISIDVSKEISAYLKLTQNKIKNNFHPHITIGRVKEIFDKNSFQKIYSSIAIEKKKFCYSSISLYDRILKSDGPTYKRLYIK
ncbi:MAG: hypothetical protein V1859_03290 [archaeon]